MRAKILKIISTDEKTINISFSGRLNIDNINQTIEKLKDIVDSNETINVVIQDVDFVEISFLQMLIALKKTCKIQNKALSVKFNLSEKKDKLLENSGIKTIKDFLSQ